MTFRAPVTTSVPAALLLSPALTPVTPNASTPAADTPLLPAAEAPRTRGRALI
jgi:hypothetical protein